MICNDICRNEGLPAEKMAYCIEIEIKLRVKKRQTAYYDNMLFVEGLSTAAKWDCRPHPVF
jgi:hypothetical protein